MTNDINITIGSDSEFVIMCGDKVENALEIFKRVSEMEHCCELYNALYNVALKDEYFTPLEKDALELYSEIQQMELYPTYEDEIDTIFEMIEKHKVWELETNILPRWAELW